MAELAFALQAAGDDAELLKPLDRLMTWAESGAESQDDLVRRFDAVAEQVRHTEAQANASTIRTATLMMRDVAVWIGIGESETLPSEASLEAASAALGRGMIGEAVAALSDLEDPVEPLVRPWLAQARARLTIEKEAEHFQRIVLGRALATEADRPVRKHPWPRSGISPAVGSDAFRGDHRFRQFLQSRRTARWLCSVRTLSISGRS